MFLPSFAYFKILRLTQLTIYPTISRITCIHQETHMHTEKISISLPTNLTHFLGDYQKSHSCKSKSEVVAVAIKLLRQKELEKFYHQANSEIDSDFEITNQDGLDNETG